MLEYRASSGLCNESTKNPLPACCCLPEGEGRGAEEGWHLAFAVTAQVRMILLLFQVHTQHSSHKGLTFYRIFQTVSELGSQGAFRSCQLLSCKRCSVCSELRASLLILPYFYKCIFIQSEVVGGGPIHLQSIIWSWGYNFTFIFKSLLPSRYSFIKMLQNTDLNVLLF